MFAFHIVHLVCACVCIVINMNIRILLSVRAPTATISRRLQPLAQPTGGWMISAAEAPTQGPAVIPQSPPGPAPTPTASHQP